MNSKAKKSWDEETIGRVFGIMDEILYSIALYREIRPWDRDNSVFDPCLRQFWIMNSNNAILMAIINWCKIFGKKHNNKTHFSNFVNCDLFISMLSGINYDEFSDSMLNIRDKYAAHEDDIKKRGPVPELDLAMEVMETFRETVEKEYDIPELYSIRGTYESYQLQIRDQLKECKIDWEIPDTDEMDCP